MMNNNTKEESVKERIKNPDYLIKMGFVLIGVITVLVVIIGQYFWELMFSPENFNVYKWATRAILNGSISLIMIILGFIAVDESCKSRERGKFYKRLLDFNGLVQDLYDSKIIVYFDPFISWYAERQVREKRIRYLTKHGMARLDAEAIVDYASFDDLETISGLKPGAEPTGNYGKDLVKKDKKGKEILIPAIKDTWVSYVEDVINGTITVETEDASYYISADKNDQADLSSLERAQATERERVKSLRRSFITKILAGLVFVTILCLLGVDKHSGISDEEAVWELIFRLGSATLGFISGGFSGFTDARFSYRWLGDKMRVIRDFNKHLEAREFVPIAASTTIEDRIKAVKAREEAEKRKALKESEEYEEAQLPEEPKDNALELIEEGGR